MATTKSKIAIILITSIHPSAIVIAWQLDDHMVISGAAAEFWRDKDLFAICRGSMGRSSHVMSDTDGWIRQMDGWMDRNMMMMGSTFAVSSDACSSFTSFCSRCISLSRLSTYNTVF